MRPPVSSQQFPGMSRGAREDRAAIELSPCSLKVVPVRGFTGDVLTGLVQEVRRGGWALVVHPPTLAYIFAGTGAA
jgi:hypothetical protein